MFIYMLFFLTLCSVPQIEAVSTKKKILFGGSSLSAVLGILYFIHKSQLKQPGTPSKKQKSPEVKKEENQKPIASIQTSIQTGQNKFNQISTPTQQHTAVCKSETQSTNPSHLRESRANNSQETNTRNSSRIPADPTKKMNRQTDKKQETHIPNSRFEKDSNQRNITKTFPTTGNINNQAMHRNIISSDRFQNSDNDPNKNSEKIAKAETPESKGNPTKQDTPKNKNLEKDTQEKQPDTQNEQLKKFKTVEQIYQEAENLDDKEKAYTDLCNASIAFIYTNKRGQYLCKNTYSAENPLPNSILHHTKSELDIKRNIGFHALTAHITIPECILPMIDRYIEGIRAQQPVYYDDSKRTEENNVVALLETDYKNMNPFTFVQRCFANRPLTCYYSHSMGGYDMLLQNPCNNEYTTDYKTLFDERSTDYNPCNYALTRPEMQFSGFLQVVSHTLFINNGARTNMMVPDNKGSYIPEGVYVGLAGPSFENLNQLDTQLMWIVEKQNTEKNGFGMNNIDNPCYWDRNRLWAEFYKEFLPKDNNNTPFFPTYDEITKTSIQNEKNIEIDDDLKKLAPNSQMKMSYITTCQGIIYLKIENHYKYGTVYFNTGIYTKKMKILINSYLNTGAKTAKKRNENAYIRANSIGTGAFLGELGRIQNENPKGGQMMFPFNTTLVGIVEAIQLDIYKKFIENSNYSEIIPYINFAWFQKESLLTFIEKHQKIKKTNFTAHQVIDEEKKSSRWSNPADPFPDITSKKPLLLVAMYLWDHASMIGNEYWKGSQYFAYSSDPAAATSSTISEIQNPGINKHILQNIVVIP